MKKFIQVFLIAVMLLGVGFSVMNFIGTDLNASPPDAGYPNAVRVDLPYPPWVDCWRQHQIDCYLVDVMEPKD